MKNFLQVNRALVVEKNIYLNLNQLPSKNDGGQSCDGNRQSRLMSQSGCSAVDVPMTSYGAPDDHPMSTRSASDGTRWNSRVWKYVAMIFAVLMMSIANIGMAWAWTDCYYCDANVGWTSTSFKVASGGSGSCYIYMGTNHFFKFRINSKPVGESGNKELTTDGVGVRLYTWNSGDPDAAKYTGNPGIVEVHVDQSTGDHDKDPWVWLTRPTVYIRHKWNDGSWSNKAMTDNNDGTYTYIGQYSGSSQTNVGPCESCDYGGDYFKYFSSATLTGSPAKGDRCLFTYNSSGFRGYGGNGSNKGSLSITKLCSITYDGNGKTGGSVPTSQTDIVYNTSTIVSGNVGSLVKTGCAFIGWNTAKDGTGKFYLPGSTFTPTATSHTLYAQWLQLHEPGVYESSEGYNKSLKTYSGREYEIYRYAETSSVISIFAGETSTTTKGDKHCVAQFAKDASSNAKFGGWIMHNGGYSSTTSKNSDTSAEFSAVTSKGIKGWGGQGYFIYVSGYDQFDLWAQDKNLASNYYIKVYRDGVDVTANKSQDQTVRPYTLDPSSSYLIRIECLGNQDSNGDLLVGFSLRLPPSSCTAPSALAAASPTAKGITLSVTDANDVNNYEFYVSTESTAPEAGATATHSVSSAKSLTITNLVAGTKYYAWVRSKCSASNKSAWVSGGNFTTSTVNAAYHLTNVSKTSGAGSGIGGSTFTAVFAAVSGYSMPTPTITVDGNTLSAGNYTWSDGTITIPANKINGNIDITLNSAPAAPSSVAITGNWLYFAGETIELTATPTGGNGPVTYQWYKGGKENGNAIEGETTATYTKATCAFDDAGSYYCKVTCGGSASTWGQNGDAYEVKVPHLYVKTGRNDGVKSDFRDVDFTRVDASTATASMTLGANWDYCYNIADGCGHYYGNKGTMQYNNYGPWVTNVNNQDCGLRTTNGATYVFTINYSNWTELKTTVTFPSVSQAADKVIYFDNNDRKWSTLHYRIGKIDHTQATAMTKVPGTDNLYKVTTTAYNNFMGWQIGNAAGDNGSGKSIYNTQNAPAITASTAHEGGAVTESAVTVTPTTSRGNGSDVGINDNCEFYNYTITDGMKTDRVTITEPSNGTITVNYTNTSNVASTLTSGYADLAHTVILTSITTSPNEGYDAGAITINGSAYSGANYVVTGATTIAATFTPQVYSITYKDQGGADFSGSHADGYPTTHTYGTATTLKTASKTGYTFGGWYGNSGCTGEVQTSIGATSITAGIILYAKWTPAATLYTVTFDSNGGSTTPDAIEQASEDASITMPAAPTYSGHTFQGWVIGGSTYAAGASYAPTANVTAYASWKADCAGGGGGGSTTTTLSWFDTSQGSRSSSNYPSSLAKWLYGYSNSAKSSAYAYTITTANTNNKGQGTGDSDYLRFDNGSSIYIYADNTTTSGTPASFNDVTAVSLKIKLTKDAGTSATIDIKVGSTTIADDVDLSEASTSSFKLYEFEADNLDGTIQIIHNKSGDSKYNLYIDDIAITTAGGGGATCHYVTYDGNGADGGSVSDKTAYTSGTNVTVLGNVDSPAAFTKTDYRFNGWNTAANGSGTSYAAGDKINNIRANVTLYAQWVADACSAPSEPTISGTSVRTVGQTITLNAACATGADASTTYTWYKGVDWATAFAALPVQEALTAEEGGRIFDKASCVAGDAGTYWCEASNGDDCEAHNATGFAVTVNAAVEEHIYYYKDANHYSEGTYSNPEGNEAVKKDNQSLSSPWMICNGCKAGVDSVVAHGATYDGKGNHMNAYIKLPTGGDATTKNIKFALTAGYTGTLTMKIGGYENNPTVTLQPLVAGVLGDAIAYTGTVSGVATTENNFGEITWNLTTAGGTYVLTVTSKTGYISQIDMTTETSARFNVTYNGNGNTGGTVPTDATNYDSDATVTVAANTGDGKLVKENYTGAGWNTANNGTGTNYVPGSGTFTITANTTLYAHWTQLITLAPGTHGTGTSNAAVSWNGSVLRGFAAHTASGYALQGYYTEPSGGTKVLNADGSFAATNIDGFVTSGKWSNTGAAPTLYAQWSGSAIVTNTLGVGSSSKWKSTISTTAPLQITDLSALAAVGGLTIEDANGTSADGRALTCKVGASGATTKTDDKYLQLSFSIAAGYKLRVTGLDVTVRSVSKAGKYHLELVGTTGSLIPDDEQVASGAVNTIFDDAYNVELTGDVTLKLWAYGKDGSNLMEYYRLGSPIAIYGAVEETCTPPTFSGLDYSATEYTQGATASAISVTGAENEDSYQWYYNTVNDRSDATKTVEAGATSASFTPSTTAAFGTRYYWCELKNTCTTVKTPTVAVTVSASASNPTVTWSDVKLNGAATTVNYGGGKYELRATVNETGWSGTLESSMVTAPAGIYIHNIGTGTEDSKQYIEFQFDVTTAFDREANETIGFHLSLPAISGTPNWNALTSDKQVSYTACDGGEGEGGMIYLPLTETQTTAASGMKYYWETAGSGRLASQYGGSAMGSTLAAEPYHTADHDFPRYAASTGDKWMFQTYVGGVNKVRVVFRAGGALKSSNLTISKFCYDTEYFSSQGDRQVSIGEVSPSKASFASGEDGYMEFTVPEMAANSYAYFQTGSSNIKIYGIVLYSESSGSGGSVETDPTWTGGLNKDGSSVVERAQGAANFTYTISTTTNTLGGITYSSSNSSVAEVNAKTGEVRITATGESTQTAVITATLARSGCYQPATRTYTVRVTGNACTDPIGTIAAEDLGCSGTRLTFSGYADGANIKWYRNGTEIPSATSAVYTTTDAGSYYAVAHLNCDRQSNTIVVTAAEVDADRVVEKWYIKNGRLTPDIKLWTLDEGSHLVSVAWSPSNATGLDQEGDIYESESDGAVYLTGRAPDSNDTGEDKSYTLTLTINNGCTGSTTLSDASKQITIVHQKNTDKHVLAFVVGNTEKKGDKYVAIGKGFTESIPASQTTNVSLYNEIAKNFDVQATNIYSTDDEQKIKEYYSQFDIICITDYPNTKTKGSHSVSFSDAIGVMVDIRPVLTMEAWVSGLSNWNKKGISGDPKSPTTRQYTMLLQCKDHEIFTGTTLTKVGEGEDAMYRVTMVNKNKEEYKTLDANYGDGEHKANEGYQYGKKPALQGFTFSQAMADADLLPLGLIDDGAGNDLQVGLERQREMSARMMVLGINSTAMERLTADGERVVINALNYLMKKNAEDIADCSTSFVGGAEGDEENWMNADNWTGNTVPDKTQKVRILAPCVVPEGEKVHVAGVLIAPNDGGTYNGGSTPTTGSLTIAAGGALVVDGKIQAVTAPAYNRPRATSAGDLAVLANADGNGTLIFENGEGETKATIQMYSKAVSDADNDYENLTWQYVAVPFSDNNNAHHNYYNSWLYAWAADNSGWEVVPNRGNVYPWIGYCITQDAPKTYTMDGTLVETSQQEFTVPAGVPAAPVEKVIGNSWTAPLQVKQFTDEDFGSLTKNIYLFNTGFDDDANGGDAETRYQAGTYVTIPIHSSTYSGDSLVSSLQAFFVKNESGSEATLTLDYDRHVRPTRSTDKVNAGPMHAPSRFIASDEPTVLKIWASGSRYDDRLILLEREDFSTGYDAGWDGDKWKEGDASPRIYTIMESGEEAITATPELEGTIIGFRAGEDNSYTLRFEYNESNDPLYILDTENRIYTRVLTDQTYQFTTNDKAAHSRFVLTRTDGQMTPTGIDDVQGDKVHEAKAKKFIMDDKMYILFNGRVFDATGKAVK